MNQKRSRGIGIAVADRSERSRPSASNEAGSSAAPVLDAKPRDADHVAEVGRDERRIESEGMRRNGGIKILNPRSTAFQGRFDAAEHPADDIGPLGSWEFRGDEIEARLQRRPALRTRQPFDAKRDLRNHRLR